MVSQIFKKDIPNEILLNLLDKIAFKTEKRYILNHESYKKGMLHNYIVDFMEQCKDYYFLSKQKYLDRKLTYNSFITVVRQICNYNKVTYTSQIKYSKSNYDIEYYIYV
uniref:Uncharacterized protein n=1 Tax=viral metagenome TaxID=1070528 RepID=A0A6C0E1Q7_9ZZZZ